MSHHTNIVKNKDSKTKSKPHTFQSFGPVDLHFHGAFGIDLMSARLPELNELSRLLWKKGVGGFCATTLSTSKKELKDSVTRLGRWIQAGNHPGARPFGIHLEGPFISPLACGAHPPHTIRKLDPVELDGLWEASQGTLKILTVAPETLSIENQKRLNIWARKKKIVLSLGHSRATLSEAAFAFKNGFQGITHAWNALPFHQREPGALGAAFGNSSVYLELIIDQVHVSPSVIRWTRKLHPTQSICFISDCVPAGGLSREKSYSQPKWYSFGNLQIRFQDHACRLKNGSLAGGGYVLTESYIRWLKNEARFEKTSARKVLENSIHHLTMVPFRVLGIVPSSQKDRQVLWETQGSHRIGVIPIDSHSGNG